MTYKPRTSLENEMAALQVENINLQLQVDILQLQLAELQTHNDIQTTTLNGRVRTDIALNTLIDYIEGLGKGTMETDEIKLRIKAEGIVWPVKKGK
jgi:hypothetical protein